MVFSAGIWFVYLKIYRGPFIERKVIEEPLGKVCENALNKFLNKNGEENRYLNMRESYSFILKSLYLLLR